MWGKDMDRHTYQAVVRRLCRIIAVIVICAICFSWGFCTGSRRLTAPTDYTQFNAAQLSWVIEGIEERMSELSDDLHYAQHLQAEKMNRG